MAIGPILPIGPVGTTVRSTSPDRELSRVAETDLRQDGRENPELPFRRRSARRAAGDDPEEAMQPDEELQAEEDSLESVEDTDEASGGSLSLFA